MKFTVFLLARDTIITNDRFESLRRSEEPYKGKTKKNKVLVSREFATFDECDKSAREKELRDVSDIDVKKRKLASIDMGKNKKLKKEDFSASKFVDKVYTADKF